MSYILDALKKAEEERRRGVVPDVTTVHDVRSIKGRSVRSYWPYLLLAVLLLNAVAVVWWLGPWNGERQVVTMRKVKSEAVMNGANRMKDVPDKGAADVSLPAGKPEAGNAVAAGMDKRGGVHPSVAVKARPDQTGIGGGVYEKPEASPGNEEESEAKTAATLPPASDRVYALNQLPPSIRQSLPELAMSLHYFTNDPSQRLIIINGDTLRQGEETAGGLRLDEVTPNGAVLEYQHYRFRVGMRQK